MELVELRRIARALSSVENRDKNYEQLLRDAYRSPRWANVVGITGAPGAGKSTLVDGLAAYWAATGQRIAVLAVDPSSPFSGGAVLGDRIRRVRSAEYRNVYFRSLSSRGHVGGLNEAATDLIAVLGFFGFTRVILETVGAGQSDIEVRDVADCTVVVTVPGLGDGVQASKAGLMEIADIFVVNKIDLPGAEDAAQTIERALSVVYKGQPGVNLASPTAPRKNAAHITLGITALHRRHGNPEDDSSIWNPPVLRVSALANNDAPIVGRVVDSFIDWTAVTGRRLARRRERAYGQLLRVLASSVLSPYCRELGSESIPNSVAPWVERIADGCLSPLEAVRALLKKPPEIT